MDSAQGAYQQQRSQGEDVSSSSYGGVSYLIKHRHTNTTLNLQLAPNELVRAKPGTLVHMSSSVALAGNIKFSVKKLLTGSQMTEATFSGPGTVCLAPELTGDIFPLPIDSNSHWNVGKHYYLCSTATVEKELQSQGFWKGLRSGSGWFVYRMTGVGMAWLYSYGAIDVITLQPGEEHFVEHSHLVAWNCDVHIESAGGKMLTALKTHEGNVLRFTGPGQIFVQTRSIEKFQEYVKELVEADSKSS